MSGLWGRLGGIRPVKLIRKMIEAGEEDPVELFMREYGVSREKALLAHEVAQNELEAIRGLAENEVGLYIGIPFCKSRCLYCSFVTTSAGNNIHLVEEYIKCLKREIEATAKMMSELGLTARVIYIGGGTPTILSQSQIFDLISFLKKFFYKYTEFTVEAGRPDSLDVGKLEVMRDLGVDRICINPQSMNDSVLREIGRPHTAEDIREAYFLARDVGFDNINMDLIAGLPGDDLESFKASLDEICEMGPEGVTVHTLSIKRGSILNEKLNDFTLDGGKTVEEMVDYAREKLISERYKAYYLYRQKNILGNLENVGYAKIGKFGLYNIIIMEEVASIVSLGAGGVSRTVKDEKIQRIFNYKEPQLYIEGMEEILRRKGELSELLKN